MAVFALEQVSLAFDHVPLMDKAALQVESGERLALVGRNGSGKSTLLKLLAGDLLPDAGTVHRAHALRLALVPQEPQLEAGHTVEQALTSALGAVGEVVADYHRTAAQVAAAQGASAAELMARLHTLQTELEHRDGWRLHTQVETVLSRLQLDPSATVGGLSSGWQRRVAMGQALVRDPELLLLDEPTNHLDIATIEWLETYLLNFPGTLVFVTHDRAFLDRLATGIVELDRGRLRRFPANWTAYREHKNALLAVEETEAAQFDKRLAQEEDWIRQGVRARRTRNEGRVRRLMSMREERRARREVAGQVNFTLSGGRRSGQMVVEAEAISKSFGERAVLRDFSCRIMRGDRIGLVGPNGIGKTTLVRLLMGELQPDAGRLRFGTRLSKVYFDQRRAQLDPEATPWQTLCPHGGDQVLVGGKHRHVVSYLADFLFPSQSVRAPVKTLSGGERNRLLLAQLFTQPANFLVLDEPTNDLDSETLELLEGLLAEYDGTLLLASHDRAFLDGVVTSIYAFEGNGRVQEYVGGYSDWQRALQAPPAAKRRSAAPAAAARKRRSRGLTYTEQRELEGLPASIEILESEQSALHAQLDDTQLFHKEPQAFRAIMERLTALDKERDAAYARWDELDQRQAAAQDA